MLIKDIPLPQIAHASTQQGWYPLLRYFSLLSLGSIVLCAIALCILFRYVSIEDLKVAGEQNNIVLSKSLMNEIWNDYESYIESISVNSTSDVVVEQKLARLHSLVLRHIKGLSVLKVNIYSTNDKVLFSTQQDKIGAVPANFAGVQKVLQSGTAVSQLQYQKQFDSIIGNLQDRQILSTLVPIYKPKGSDIQAIIELYYDVTALFSEIEKRQVSVLILVVLILAVLYCALFVIVRRGDVVLKQQAATLQNTLLQFEQVNQNLEERVNVRTHELQVAIDELEKYKSHLESLVSVRTEELRSARDSALEASKAKSVFLANMSHELRTPLNAVIGYAELLKDQPYDAILFNKDLEKIFNAGNHLLQLINDILDISKIEAGRMDNYVEPMPINSTIKEVLSSVENLVRKKGNRINFDSVNEVGWINTDVTKFRQVLFNLLSNANKFTDNGEIRIQVKIIYDDYSRQWLKLSISDTGIGINEEKLQKIFDSFSQADESTARNFGGTGLGLTISQRLCDLLGGKITVSSQPQVGSTFVVWLPFDSDCNNIQSTSQFLAIGPKVDPRTVRFRSDSNATFHRRSKISSILVIDDDADVRDLMERFLTREGYYVYSAANADEGIVMATTRKPDIITLDILMPEKDGLTVLRALKNDADLKDIPVIIITLAGDRDVCMSLGATAFVDKPVDWDTLSTLLRKTIRQHI